MSAVLGIKTSDLIALHSRGNSAFSTNSLEATTVTGRFGMSLHVSLNSVQR